MLTHENLLAAVSNSAMAWDKRPEPDISVPVAAVPCGRLLDPARVSRQHARAHAVGPEDFLRHIERYRCTATSGAPTCSACCYVTRRSVATTCRACGTWDTEQRPCRPRC
jgi:hypothetical protein